MTKKLLLNVVLSLCAMALMLAACSQQANDTSTARLDPPEFYDDSVLTLARPLLGEAYDLMDTAVEGAIAKLTELEQLVPSGLVGPYNIACAYGRSGNVEAAFEQLNILLDNGYDKPDYIMNDSDFESLAEDPRHEALVNRARANYEAGCAVFADGMKEYDQAPETFATIEELEAWVDAESRRLRSHGRYWTSVQSMRARMDFAAKRLAAERHLKTDDPEFNYGLERLRAAAALKSPHDYNWGAVADMVVAETKAFLATNPDGEAASEANYRAAVALSHKYGKEAANRTDGFGEAESYLAQVVEGHEFFGAAQALSIINKMQSPDAKVDELGPQLKSVIEQFPGDSIIFRVVSIRHSNTGVQHLWPVELGMEDLDGKTITLEEYQGKALLIDFWATWCRPCREELPNVLEVYNQYHSQGLEIVSISADYRSRVTPEEYVAWIDSAGMDWRHSYSGDDWSTESIKRYFVGSIPSAFLVGPDGSLAAWGEDVRGEALEGTVKEALGI